MARLTVLGVALVLAGCATPRAPAPLPVAHTICLDVIQETPTELAFVRRKAADYAREHGFQVADQGCDISVKYERLGSDQGESLGMGALWVKRNAYWAQEGLLQVRHGGRVVLEDHSVVLRGYTMKQDLLQDLAWQLVRPATEHFQPPKPPQK